MPEVHLDVAAVASVARDQVAARLVDSGFHQVCPHCTGPGVCDVCDGVGIDDAPGYWVNRWVAWPLAPTTPPSLAAAARDLADSGLVAFKLWTIQPSGVGDGVAIAPPSGQWEGRCLADGQPIVTLAQWNGSDLGVALGVHVHRDLDEWRHAPALPLTEDRDGWATSPAITLDGTLDTWVLAVQPVDGTPETITAFSPPYTAEHTVGQLAILTSPPVDRGAGLTTTHWTAIRLYPSRGHLAVDIVDDGTVTIHTD